MDNDATNTIGQPPPPKRPFQFGLKHLLAVPVGLAAFFAAAAMAGPYAACLLVGLLAFPGPFFRPTRGPAMGTLCLLCLVGLCLPTYTPHGGYPRRSQCSNNLKQIALALHNYHDVHGCFPPAYVPDEDGRPMHSWRVLILPYVEDGPLYRQYRFDEPWDGPNNRQLANRRPWVYSCPSERDPSPAMTSYLAVVGPGTMWPGSKSRKLDDVTDDTSNTVLVVEVVNSGIDWMEPRDLHVLQMARSVNPAEGQGISSFHPSGACVVFASGYARFLDEDISAEELRALLSIDGGEKIDPEDL